MSDIVERLSKAITTHANDDFSKPGTLVRERFCQRRLAMLDAKSEITRLREETVKMLDERDREYNKKTNDLIARHAEQTARLRAKVAKADALAEAVRVLVACLHPLEDEGNLKAVFSAAAAYREGSDT